MAGNGPQYRITAVSKTDKAKKTRLFSVWPGKYGYSVKPEKPYQDRPGVASITLTDGTVINCDDVWLNMDAPYVPKGERDEAPKQAGDPGPDADPFGDDEPPF